MTLVDISINPSQTLTHLTPLSMSVQVSIFKLVIGIIWQTYRTCFYPVRSKVKPLVIPYEYTNNLQFKTSEINMFMSIYLESRLCWCPPPISKSYISIQSHHTHPWHLDNAFLQLSTYNRPTNCILFHVIPSSISHLSAIW